MLEKDLEAKLIRHIEDFMLELGRGFMFVGSQQRLTLGNTHYYVDMVFYNKVLKAYVLIDLKMDELRPEHAGEAVGNLAPFRQEHKFYAKVFQSLRIAVNHEIDYLKEMLQQSLEMLKPEGRLVVITYHSLEDRLVKNFMRTGNFENTEEKDFYGNTNSPFRLINKKGTTPDDDEIARNNRSRSARLRIAEKI
jgi:16S rRNA (cytosine(1402)-N(4))-methyltransferase